MQAYLAALPMPRRNALGLIMFEKPSKALVTCDRSKYFKQEITSLLNQ
jgi:hypothetical protein